jgi:hypothetical protein
MSIFSKRLSSSSSTPPETVSPSGDKVIIEILIAGNPIAIWLKMETFYGKLIAILLLKWNFIRGKSIAMLLN